MATAESPADLVGTARRQYLVETASRLYGQCGSWMSNPKWEQLGGVTQGVWIERAEKQLLIKERK